MSKTILIVDDNATDRIILNGFLKENYTIIEAKSGTEMISVLHEKSKDISAILLDLIMPEMDGFDALLKMRSDAIYRQIPVIVASAQDDDETQARAFSLGAAGFTFKPYNKNILLHLLENIISLREKSYLFNSFTIDPLTGLMNRTAFYLRADELIKLHKPGYFVLTCFDIENFKVMNDQYGIDIGDKVIQNLANYISKAMVFLGGICCHDTADKFAMLYPAAKVESDEVKKLHESVMSGYLLGHNVKIRIGRYFVNDISLPVNTMYDRATIAEESIKGRYDIYIAEYTEEMRRNLISEQQVVNDMNTALNNGEFEPWFQPQYNHATGVLIGAEALVRWKKNGKIVPPGKFIPIFERNGFIYKIDQYIWRQVCILLRRWIDEGRNPLPVSVNISRCDLFQKDFMNNICALVEEYKLPTDMLRLEVTESAFSETTNTIFATVNELIKKGFTVEIDDFGSGYSSLNTLKDVPASILKLDMRFFENTGDAKRSGNIIESVVRMAKWLGMAVIAEGVEEKSQADYLKSIGCFYIQGYYYAKPMPAEEYIKQLDMSLKEINLTRLKTIETFDNNDFWDAKSVDTLIYNSYVGAACIIEYVKNKIEMIRANDYYEEMIGSKQMNIQDFLSFDWTAHMDEKTKRSFSDAVIESVKIKKTVSKEFIFTGIPGCPEKVYLSTRLRVIGRVGDRFLIYCLNNNITAQKEAEIKERNIAAQMQAMMANMQGGVTATLYHDDDSIQFIFANDGFYEMYGYTKEQMATEMPNALDMILPEDRKKTMETVARIVKNRGSETYRYRCYKRDGSIMWVRCTISVISIKGIGDTVLLGVSFDITKECEAEFEKNIAINRLKTVMNAMTNGMTAVAFHDNGMEFLFANNRFYEMYGIKIGDIGADKLSDALNYITLEYREKVRNAIHEAVRKTETVSMEYQIKRPDGIVRWINVIINITKLSGINAPVMVAVLTDITEQKKTSDQIRFLNQSAREILAQSDSEKAINETLRNLQNYFASERAYIFELNDATQTSDNTYEVCAPGVKSEMERLQCVSYDIQQYWFDSFNKEGFVAIPDIVVITNESETAMRDLLLAQNIHSIIVAPLWRDKKLIGYIGIDNPTKAVDQVSQLIALTDYIAVLLTRRDLMKSVERGRQTVQQLIDDTPGGFLRLHILPDSTPVIISYNAGFCRMLGMTGDEIMAEYGNDAHKCIITEDITMVRNIAEKARADDGLYTYKCRLKKKNGTVIWVQVFGRYVKDENGELFRNSFFTDITH